MDLRKDGLLGAAVAGHSYYRAKTAAVVALPGAARPACVLDVGAGTGFFSRQLLRRDHVTSATCVDPGYGCDRDELIEGKPLLFRRSVARASADLVLLMDGAEDAGLLRSCVRQVEIGGVVEASGLAVENTCCPSGALFPLAAATRLLGRLHAALTGRDGARSQMRLCGRLCNGALWAACRAALLMFRRSKLLGLTAMVIARKPA